MRPFRFQTPDHMVAVPTTLVRVRIAYLDPMTSPAANGPGQQDWVVPYKKPIHPVKAVTVKWVVLSGTATAWVSRGYRSPQYADDLFHGDADPIPRGRGWV